MTDAPAAVEFLKKLYPEGPWTLQTIDPTGSGGMTGITFYPNQEEEVEHFIRTFNTEYENNVYFSVNVGDHSLGGGNEKFKSVEIKEVWYFASDLDPAKHEDREEGRKACLARLTTQRPDDVPEPTFIIDSGNGYWGLWRLTEPLRLNGTEEWANAAALYNRGLAGKLAADFAATDVARIARLPGTINYPNKKKLDAGYVPVPTALVSYHDVSYDKEEFSKAEKPKPTASVAIDTPDEVQPLSDFDILVGHGVPFAVCNVIRDGYDQFRPSRWGGTGNPDDPTEGIDRSQMVYYLTNELLRRRVPNEVIAGFLINPDFKASEHVIAQPGTPVAYVYKQIKHALEKEDFSQAKKAAPPIGEAPAAGDLSNIAEDNLEGLLAFMNDNYAVIKNLGGKTAVVELTNDDRPAMSAEFFDFKTLQEQLMNVPVLIDYAEGRGGVLVPKFFTGGLGRWWLCHPNRRTYESVGMFEGEGDGRLYNSYRGFRIEPAEGDCSLYMSHLRENVCNGNEEHIEYLLNWMARAVQKPLEHGRTAVVLCGSKGTGKSAFVDHFGNLWHSKHYLASSEANMFLGGFNSHLADKIVLFADEAFFSGDAKNDGKLKTLITEINMPITMKFRETATGARSYAHMIMATNQERPVNATGDERRFFVLKVGEGKQRNNVFFETMRKQMKNGGSAALLHELLSRDISDFEPYDLPTTEALQRTKQLSMDPLDEWWFNALQEGDLLGDDNGWPEHVATESLKESYTEYIADMRKLRPPSAVELAARAKNQWGLYRISRKTYAGKQKRSLGVPPLEQARVKFEEKYGPIEWEVVAPPDPVAHEDERPPF